MADQPAALRAVFCEALDHTTPEARAEYLDRACQGQPELRDQVEALLRANAEVGSFLNEPSGGMAATIDDPIHERPGVVIGPYKLLEQIGEGGFGVVFLAEQTQPVRRKVALKVLKPGMDTRQVVTRFEAERQALAIMDHPHIAQVHDGGQTVSGRPYFVMELVRGVPITDFCDRNHLPVRGRLELFLSVCQAVQHAHHKGIIHRDLKPSNVLVTVHDTTPVVKVIDFGVAKALGQELTDKTLFTGIAQMIGTPLYMSPEQAGMSGLDIDTRSDIYALGVLLYELLTGTTPFDRERLRKAGYDEIRRIICEEEPLKPSARISTLGQAAATVSASRQSDPRKLGQLFRGELDWIVLKALEKDRNRRYETTNGLAMDIRHYLHDEPVLACPPSAWYRFRKFARRNRRSLATAIVLGLAAMVVVGAVAGSLGWMARDRLVRQAKLNLEIEHALDDATKARDQALKLTDNPYRWGAALAEAVSELKRAQGLALQDEAGVTPDIQMRLEAVQALLNGDETDRRFAVRFEEIRLEQTEVDVAISEFKMGIAFAALKDAFRHHYQIVFGVTAVTEVATIIQQRPKPIQDILLAALEVSLENVATNDQQARPWLAAGIDAADTGPWRKRAQQALKSSDWKAVEQVVEEAVTAGQPLSLLLLLAAKTPYHSPVRRRLLRRIAEAYPGDFWANHELANQLLYCQPPQLDEAVRYYGAALAVRPGHVAANANLGNALRDRGNLDGAINAYRAALHGHPDYTFAHERLGEVLLRKRSLDEAIAEFTKVSELNPKNAPPFFKLDPNQFLYHNGLGNALYSLRRLDEAIGCYENAIALNPGYAVLRVNLGNTLYEQGKVDKAIACYKKAIELDPNYSWPYCRIGQVQWQRVHSEKAILCVSAGFCGWPRIAGAAAYCLNQEPVDDAIRNFGKAIELDPQNGAAHSGLGGRSSGKGADR